MDYFKTKENTIQHAMIRKGVIDNWMMYKVDYPNGSTYECDFRAVCVFRGMTSVDKLKDSEFRTSIIKEIWPEKTRLDIAAEFNEVIDFRYAHIYHMKDALIPEATTNNLMVVNFMDVQADNRKEYIEMETGVFKPLHHARYKSGKMIDWVVAQRIIPYGSEIQPDYITIDKFQPYPDMHNPNFKKEFEEAHPTKNFVKTMDRMAELRTVIKPEIWRTVPIDKVN
ncbi:MAG: hypothetical protein P1U56_04095 [Saprospiraceae bacterium]|nr:hypothetical protein [Saprospiraceae bacterium]